MRDKPTEPANAKKQKNAATRAAGKALRRIMPGDHPQAEKPSARRAVHQTADIMAKEDPRHGLSDESVVRSGHFMLMLKPQIVLRSEAGAGTDLVAVGE